MYTETPLVLFGDVFRPQEVEVTDHGLGVHVWRHRGNTNTSGWHTRFQTASVTARTIPGLRRIHPRTVHNRLCEHHIRPRQPCVRTLLLPRHHAERLRWSRAHQRWRLREWEAVLFSNESRFILDHSNGRIMVYHSVGERYKDACFRQRRAFGGGSVMVWGGISAHGRTPMAIINGNRNAHRYLKEVVRPNMLLFVRGQRRNMTFQQDNARPHVARLIMNFLWHENVLVMAWPSMSPDLSPIEHVWDKMDRRLRQRPNLPVTLQGLGETLQEVWLEIPPAFHANLVASMRRRCQECVNARGGHTHYWRCELLFDPHCVVTS